MSKLPDKWNPRLWLRDWLSAPSQAEIARDEFCRERDRRRVAAADARKAVRAQESPGPDSEISP